MFEMGHGVKSPLGFTYAKLLPAETHPPLYSSSPGECKIIKFLFCRYSKTFSLKDFRSPFSRLSLTSFIAIFILLISGTLVSVSGATAYCDGWPVCNPIGTLGWLNLAHRGIVALTAVAVAILFARAWQTQRSQPGVLVTVTATTVLFLAQALMGAFHFCGKDG